jgi:murein DD-endopeptidase MepM/ murein hydrolase activator NlpD
MIYPAFLLAVIVSAGLATAAFLPGKGNSPGVLRRERVFAWLANPAVHPEWAAPLGLRCGNAPFVLPTGGLIGFLWGDSFRIGHRHQGIDIFGGTPVGRSAVVAAYPGYLTRLPEWKSSLIIRVPDDPLKPGRQIWTYYTHMADSDGNSFISADFPPGTNEQYIEAGTLIGYQGNYSGDPGNPVGVHLHFSIVRDDGSGRYLNELDIENTYDPSPYLGLRLNANDNTDQIPVCEGQ